MDRDVEVLGRNAWNFQGNDGAIGARPQIERREFRGPIEGQASEQPGQVGLRSLRLMEGIETSAGRWHPSEHHVAAHVSPPLFESNEVGNRMRRSALSIVDDRQFMPRFCGLSSRRSTDMS
jgi:hypothetical protein